MLVGIDVSDYQGAVDWDSVAQTHQFAFCKATEGTAFVCHTFKQNWPAMKAANIVRGAYHFAQPDQNSPQAEANFFLQQISDLEPGDMLALDLEAGSGDLSAWALAFMQAVAAQTGTHPLLYSGAWFLSPRKCTANDDLAQYGLWLAAYCARLPEAPPNWGRVAIWQHTDSASVAGVNGLVDESYFLGELGDLAKYGKPMVAASSGSSGSSDGAPPNSSAGGGGAGAPADSAPTPSDDSPAPAPAPAPGDYVFRKGDSLDSIAAALRISVAALLALNPQVTEPAAVTVGDALHIPPASSVPVHSPPHSATSVYTVQSGDTMTSIASRLGVSLLALEHANPHVADPNLINIGEVLIVPILETQDDRR